MRDNTRHDRRKTTLTYKVRHSVAADEEPRPTRRCDGCKLNRGFDLWLCGLMNYDGNNIHETTRE